MECLRQGTDGEEEANTALNSLKNCEEHKRNIRSNGYQLSSKFRDPPKAPTNTLTPPRNEGPASPEETLAENQISSDQIGGCFRRPDGTWNAMASGRPPGFIEGSGTQTILE